jgi:hypothetical protein
MLVSHAHVEMASVYGSCNQNELKGNSRKLPHRVPLKKSGPPRAGHIPWKTSLSYQAR